MASSSRQPQEHGRTIKVTILASEWGSSKGGLSTINRELAIQLAKYYHCKVTFFLLKCSHEDTEEAQRHGISLVKADRKPGYDELDLLSFPPRDLQIDVVVGHGVKLGKQAQVIRESHKCKWIQVVHTDPEKLGMYKCYENPIAKGEKKHNVEVELCQMADLVVGVGPKLTEAFRKYLRWCKKGQDIFEFTPSIFAEFASVEQALDERKPRSVLVFGRGDDEDFELKGFDIAAKSVAALPDTHLVFVGAPVGKVREIAKRLLDSGIPKGRLSVRGFKDREALKRLFCEVDLVLMPSRTEGFGLAGLEALSAGLPVIVSKNSGFGEALGKVTNGSSFVIDSEDPSTWTAAIKGIWNKDRQLRLDKAKVLRGSYGERYSWSKQCENLLETMFDLLEKKQGILIVFITKIIVIKILYINGKHRFQGGRVPFQCPPCSFYTFSTTHVYLTFPLTETGGHGRLCVLLQSHRNIRFCDRIVCGCLRSAIVWDRMETRPSIQNTSLYLICNLHVNLWHKVRRTHQGL